MHISQNISVETISGSKILTSSFLLGTLMKFGLNDVMANFV